MAQSNKPNVLNIPSHQNFFESLLKFLSENFSKNISDVKIFLPNQRSCRELRELFLQKSFTSHQNSKPDSRISSTIILPKIKAISDISFEDFFDFLPAPEVKEIIDGILQIKVISGIDYLFFLSQKIQKLSLFGPNLESNQALNIAINLKSLFDEIEKDEIDLDKLSEIDDSDLSAHRQITLGFLKNFHIQIKNSLIKENIFFSSSYHNFVIEKFSQSLEKYGSKFPIVIAGSTGSLASGSKLIRSISKQKNGFAILHNLDHREMVLEEEYHPQFLLNKLVKFLEIEKKEVQKILDKKLQISCEDRSEFLSFLMLPNQETVKWQEIETHLNVKNISEDLEKNFKFIESKDELEEARIITLILAEKLAEKEVRCAVITNNQKLTQLVKYQLEELGLSFNDSSNLGIFDSPLVNFILLILELIESDFASANLLAVVKNPLFKCKNENASRWTPQQVRGDNGESEINLSPRTCCGVHLETQQNLTVIIEKFETEILRQGRTKLGLEGILDKLESLNNQDLSLFFKDFCHDLDKISHLKNPVNISDYTKLLIATIENLTEKKWHDLLTSESAQIELFEFFENLKLQNNFTIEAKNSLAIFKTLFSQISYFEKSDALAPIQLLSTVEARLINHDLVIVASLNEGDFPEIEAENWLGKKIRKDLGVDKKLQKIGQNAYDFCNYLCNKSVVLTRSNSRNGALAISSPFLLKLTTLCKKMKLNLDFGEKYFELLKNLESCEISKIERPNPKPALEFRPKKLAVTDISKLLSDPYTIYAKRILQLRELQKIDFEPSYAEFGNFVHKALEEFIKNPHERSIDNFEKYFIEAGFISTQAKLLWWPKFENIFENFLEQNSELEVLRNYTEIPVKLIIKEILISGKIDRVIFNKEGFAEIFDYKTGQIPATKNVFSGIEPQLTIAALMLIEGIIENDLGNINSGQITSLNYWKLSPDNKNKITEISKKSEEIEILIAAAKAGLERLFEYFKDENNGYISAPNLENYNENEYCHLARIKEWI